MRNRNGPRVLPRGTPPLTEDCEDIGSRKEG